MDELERLQDMQFSVDYMLSDDWKKRFIAEYAQLITRMDILIETLWADEEEEVPDLNCPEGLLTLQVDKMSEYKQILEIRAEVCGIDLEEEIRKLNNTKTF